MEHRSVKRNKAEIFVRHIENHLKEKGLITVICKICGKTINEIVKEETNKGIWIADDIYDANTEYIDRNGKRFKIIEEK